MALMNVAVNKASTIDLERLRRAYASARAALLAERNSAGYWEGELSSSALSTATAVSALAIAARHAEGDIRARYKQLIDAGLVWIFARQNSDGGWGDTDKSLSNISTTMLVRAATYLASSLEKRERRRPESTFHLQYSSPLSRAEHYIAAQGGVPGLRKRYGKDKTFAAPILTNCALAGLVPWREVSVLPFEAACLPQSWYRFARLPVVSYAIPALVAIGQAKYFHDKPWNPLTRGLRALSVERSLCVLQKMQPASGGFLEATPLTSFVVMSLASIGRHEHPVTQLGLKFIEESARDDGSWPIDTNLATWVTTLSINALGRDDSAGGAEHLTHELFNWVLSCQHRERHPFTGAAPGGWGWSDLSGAVPDADDTPAALLALDKFAASDDQRSETDRAAIKDKQHTRRLHAEGAAVEWLLGLQNSDHGFPTFCRGWGKLPFDRSGTDLTAHVLRAFESQVHFPPDELQRPIDDGFSYLQKKQRVDGSWLPLWFGNQWGDDDENPLYGTAKVLLAYRDLGRMTSAEARRGVAYLVGKQNADGGWGGRGLGLATGANRQAVAETSATASVSPNESLASDFSSTSSLVSSVEETAVVVESLLAVYERSEVRTAVDRGLIWLIKGVETGRFREPSPIGFYFAKLWYYEKLYPLIFTVAALRKAVEVVRTSE